MAEVNAKELKQQVIYRVRADFRAGKNVYGLNMLVTNRLEGYKNNGVGQCKDQIAGLDFDTIQEYYCNNHEELPEGLENLEDDDIIDLCDNLVCEILGFE